MSLFLTGSGYKHPQPADYAVNAGLLWSLTMHLTYFAKRAVVEWQRIAPVTAQNKYDALIHQLYFELIFCLKHPEF